MNAKQGCAITAKYPTQSRSKCDTVRARWAVTKKGSKIKQQHRVGLKNSYHATVKLPKILDLAQTLESKHTVGTLMRQSSVYRLMQDVP